MIYGSLITERVCFDFENNFMLIKDKEVLFTGSKRWNELIFLQTVLDCLEDLLLNEGNRPYFAPLLVILPGIRSTKGNLYHFNLHNEFFQSSQKVLLSWILFQTEQNFYKFTIFLFSDSSQMWWFVKHRRLFLHYLDGFLCILFIYKPNESISKLKLSLVSFW